jgi:nickel superoxide dismutase
MKKYCVAGLSVVCLMTLATAVVWTTYPHRAVAHCQVPCGIYDDAARIQQLKEDTTTIGKAVQNVIDLSGKNDAQSVNQATRWIMTKEDHATNIIRVVSEYFLTQKVKPVAPDAEGYNDYLKSLADHHAVMVAAMKTKQTVEKENVDNLNKAIDALAKHYEKH